MLIRETPVHVISVVESRLHRHAIYVDDELVSDDGDLLECEAIDNAKREFGTTVVFSRMVVELPEHVPFPTRYQSEGMPWVIVYPRQHPCGAMVES